MEGEYMQKEGPQWDPISINYHLPWASRLLIIYLLAVIIIALVKSASILRALNFLKWRSLRQSHADDLLLVWKKCSNRVQSIKKLVVVTLLWTALVVTILLKESLGGLVEGRVFGPAAFVGS
jgi:hypothetical protein